jgi:ATP-dependent RNA circularization protein (DNA/RNA ligase family)
MFRKYEKTWRIKVPQYPEISSKHYLSDAQVKDLFNGTVTITEKLDGANTGIIRTKTGFRLQKRGSLVDASEHEQFNFFKAWSNNNYDKLMKIPVGITVYGELMRCVHTIYYNKLPDWFLVFGIFDGNSYCSWNEVANLSAEWGLHTVPHIYSGSAARATIVPDYVPNISTYGEEQAEGVVVYNYKKQMRGKIVKPAFLKSMEADVHWIKKDLKTNKLLEVPSVG